MKRKLITFFVAMMVIGTVGCGANDDSVVVPAKDTARETVDESTETDISSEVSDEAEDVVETEEAGEPADASALSGTWQTASIIPEDKKYSAEHYVQFTDTEINYGSLTDDGKFELDYADKIDSIKEVSDGIYQVKAQSEKGIKYTYQTQPCEDDDTIMGYYGTWDENEFANTYSGGASIFKCNIEK